MIAQYTPREAYLKRIPTVVDLRYGVQNYDIDNLYPQRADEVRNRSFTLKSAIDRLVDFIKGQGFEDPNLANMIFNSEGMTGNDLLDFIAQDKAPFAGFALHFRYNLNYRIQEITPLNWMYCRYGLPDERGEVWDIKYNTNWERDGYKHITNTFEVESYPVFNPDPAVVQAEINEHGIDCYPGQILFWTPKPGMYPKASFDAVFDNAQTQSEIGVFELSSIQNGFTAAKIFKWPGELADETQRQQAKDKLNEHKGARGANSVIVVATPDGQESKSLVEDLQMTNTDKMFEFTSKNVRNAIRESLGMPGPLLGEFPDGGMFNQQEMEDAYRYANTMTQGHRDQLERVFKKILAFWKDHIQFTSFKIKQTVYGASTSQTEVTPGQTGAPGAAPVQERKVDKSLSKMSAGEQQTFDRILSKYKKGKYTREVAVAHLKMIFGYTDEEIKAFIP